MRILISDNSDSFTANLEHLIAQRLETIPTVIPYSLIGLTNPDEFDLLVISAGPGHPSEYTGYTKLIDSGIPVLGICLGMQIINEHSGGSTARHEKCFHGRTETIKFDSRSFSVARYNSLCVNRVGVDLDVIAVNPDGLPMALRHTKRATIGYQFHPESFLTAEGEYFIDYAINFIEKRRSSELSFGRV